MTFFNSKITSHLLSLFFCVFLFVTSTLADNNSALAKQWLINTEKEVSAQLKKLSILPSENLGSIEQKNKFFKNAYDLAKNNPPHITYLAFEYDTLVFWSNYYPAFEDFLHKICYEQNYIELKNGFFKVVKSSSNTENKLKWYALIKITNKYIFENEFLKNEFVAPLNQLLTGEVHLKKEPIVDEKHENISNIADEPFYVGSKINTTNYKYNTPFYFFMIAFLLFLVFAIPSILIKNRHLLFFNFFALLLLSLNYLELPNDFFNNNINGPRVFGNANSFAFKSLVSAYITSLILFLFSIYSRKINNRYSHILSLISNVTFIFLFLFNIHKNSTIPFNLFEPADFNLESAMSFIILIIAFSAIHNSNFNLTKAKSKYWFYISLCALVILSLILIWMPNTIVWLIWIGLFIAFRLIVFAYFANRFFIKHLLIVIVISFGTSLFIYQNNLEKENNEKTILADNLVFGKDIVAESFFSALKQRIVKDKTLKQLLSQNIINTYSLQQHVQQNLLNGYWDKFNVELAIFDSLCFPLTPHREVVLDNNSYYDEIIKKEAEPTPDKDFYQLNNTEFQYLAKIKLYNDLPKPKLFSVYLGFKSKEKPINAGFPDLLLDKKLKLPKALRKYDYAFYNNNVLVEVFGNSRFPNRTDKVKDLTAYSIFKKNAGTSILISNKTIDLKSTSTIFSIMMIVYFLSLVLSLLLQRIVLPKTVVEFSLENKFQTVVAIAFTVIFCLIGYLTQNVIYKEFRAANINTLQEKTNSFAIELKNKIGEQNKLDLNFTDYLEYTLQNLSLVFNNDINIYNTNGDLIAASQPQLFDFNIISRKINSDAYNQLLDEKNNVIYEDEKIGSLQFLSAYKTIYNNEGKIIAYINVPYFAKQSNLNDALNSFINSILNFYTLLFVLALAGVLLFINYALRPLNIIKEKLSDIDLTKHNEQISYNSNDEVGLLVKSYNKMILQLEDNVQQLTQSERDKAWREMARQVAHEIKNPLTPMKLQLQLLQHVKEKATAEELKKQIDRTGTTLIEQIDILARIADEFANFAKIPEAKIESIQLPDIIHSVIQLYQQDQAIIYDNRLQNNTMVAFDKDYAIRVLNNLIKNAVQAIPENRIGKIAITTYELDDIVHLIIQDNGTGISKEIKENIFKPYFTTKSSGTGLGLVMVKNMMEHCKGEIDFVSEENVGTTFTLKFRKMK
jgi:two-component system, NtrC family, nitrogen regulation sensor histidine kinase NtrY